MCVVQILNCILASKKAIHLLSCIASVFLEALMLIITTAAKFALYQNNLSSPICPNIAAATTIGASSFTVIRVLCILDTHGSLNHWAPQKAPHPQEPDASDVSMTCGLARGPDSIIANPFHSMAMDAHYSISARASLLNRMDLSRHLVVMDRLISLHR